MPRALTAVAPRTTEMVEYDEPPLGDCDVRIRSEFAAPKHGTESHAYLDDQRRLARRFHPEDRIFVPAEGSSVTPFPRSLGNMTVGTVTSPTTTVPAPPCTWTRSGTSPGSRCVAACRYGAPLTRPPTVGRPPGRGNRPAVDARRPPAERGTGAPDRTLRAGRRSLPLDPGRPRPRSETRHPLFVSAVARHADQREVSRPLHKRSKLRTLANRVPHRQLGIIQPARSCGDSSNAIHYC